VTSSQPVVTQNAINFTPDNLRCYAYSGSTTLSTSYQEFLNFNTNSEYIVAELNFVGEWDSLGANDFYTRVYFNDVIIMFDDTSAELAPNVWPVRLIIPPFTHVVIDGKAQSGTPEFSCVLIGDVYGMIETGYQ
jgi:hypothetical protein